VQAAAAAAAAAAAVSISLLYLVSNKLQNFILNSGLD
jgi:hypothetical protein